MIAKLKHTKNGYALLHSSTDADFQKIIRNHRKTKSVSCLICNDTTARLFTHDCVLSDPPITINNKVPSGTFYLNSIC